MNIDVRNNKDFFAGLLFAVIGLAVVGIVLSDYQIGTRRNMGPGYFPLATASILTAFGLYIMIRSLIRQEKIAGAWGIRPLAMITLGIVGFGFCISSFGLLPALILLLTSIALCGTKSSLKETLIIMIVLTAAACLIFVYGLGLPLRLFIW